MPIEGLSESRKLPRLGKIHLGVKDPTKGFPVKTDYFVCPPEVERVFGEKPKELRIFIPVEDHEKWASQYYRCYSKTRGLICKGDGVTALRMVDSQTKVMADRDSKKVEMQEIPCKGKECPDYKIKCRPVMNLQFLLPEVPGLGVWQIDTSSINSIININSAAELIKSIYKRIAMIPLSLTLEPREVNNPTDGKKQTVYCLNLRVNMKLADLAIMARKQAEVYELPIGDEERPELISPDFEPDPVDIPAITAEEAEKLWESNPPNTQPTQKSTPKPIETPQDEQQDKETPPTNKKDRPKRDPSTLKTLSGMVKACFDDFKIQPKEVLAELNVKALSEITMTPADCYLQIATTKQQPPE